jgi:hypothetical protein
MARKLSSDFISFYPEIEEKELIQRFREKWWPGKKNIQCRYNSINRNKWTYQFIKLEQVIKNKIEIICEKFNNWNCWDKWFCTQVKFENTTVKSI